MYGRFTPCERVEQVLPGYAAHCDDAVQVLHGHAAPCEKVEQVLHGRFTPCEKGVQVFHSPATHCERAVQVLHGHFAHCERAEQVLHGHFAHCERAAQVLHSRFTHCERATQVLHTRITHCAGLRKGRTEVYAPSRGSLRALLQQLADCATERGVNDRGGNLCERLEDEASEVHQRVGEGQAGRVEAGVGIEDEVDVDRAIGVGAPGRGFDGAAQLALNLLRQVEQG